MTRRQLQLEMVILVAVSMVWIAGLFYVSSPRFWIDAAREPLIDLTEGEARVLPGTRDGRPVVRLPVPVMEPGPDRILILRAAAGPGFILQLIDRETRKQTMLARVPVRLTPGSYGLRLDPGEYPRGFRVMLRSRSTEDVTLESIVVMTLPPATKWIRRVYPWLGPLLLVLFLIRHRERFRGFFLDTGVPGTTLTVRSWDLFAATLVFLSCFLIFHAAPARQLMDSKFTTAVSHYLLEQGTISLPPEFKPSGRRDKTYILQSVGDRTYHFFSNAPSVLNIPFVAAFERFGVSSVSPDGRFDRLNELRILAFTAAFLAATLCAVLYLTARLWLPPPWALGLTMAFAFGTQIFSVLSRAYWSHSWAVLLLATALLLLLSPRLQHRPWASVIVCTLLCWAYFCRPPLSLSFVAVTTYLFLKRRGHLRPFLLTGVAWAGLFVAYSLTHFDSPLPPYFLSSHLRSGRLGVDVIRATYSEAMLGTLFSPGRGLFVYVPLYLAILIATIRRWRWLPDQTLATAALGVTVAHWQLISLFDNWAGGECFGPRLLSDSLPWLFVLGALSIAAVRTAESEGRFRWSRLKMMALALAIGISIFVNTQGALREETLRGRGVWNWRYPQFMAGLIPPPESPRESSPDSP